jgi:hypothetical protein
MRRRDDGIDDEPTCCRCHYFTEGTLSAVRIDDYKYRFTDQPGGWLGGTIKVDWPILTNLRLDPFERMNLPNGANGSLAFYNWFAFEFWRFQFVQKEVAEVARARSNTRRCRKARVSTLRPSRHKSRRLSRHTLNRRTKV